MNKKEFIELLNTVSDDTEIEINSICDEFNNWELSPICEAHYDKNRSKVCITPTQISIPQEEIKNE